MSDPLSEAARELRSTLCSYNLVTDTRRESRLLAAYCPAMQMNYGPAGAGEQSLTPRISSSTSGAPSRAPSGRSKA